MRLRPVESGDARLLWEWVNEPEARASAFRTEPIPWETHLAWLESRLAHADCRMYLLESEEGEPLGQIRFDRQGDTAEIDVSVAASHRGLGVGTALLREAVDLVLATDWVRRCRALVRPENRRSAGAFRQAGFRAEGTTLVLGVEAEVYVRDAG